MPKTRVHQLAKDLGLEPRDLTTHMEKLGMKGKRSQSSLEDSEVARIKAALAAPERPHVVVGTEKVVADRVVTSADATLGEIKAREQIVERRVGTNVIRRRTSRLEVISQVPPANVEVTSAPAVEETSPESAAASEISSAEPSPVVEPVEVSPVEEPAATAPQSVESFPEPELPASAPVAEPSPAPVAEAAAPQVVEEAPRGAKVL